MPLHGREMPRFDRLERTIGLLLDVNEVIRNLTDRAGIEGEHVDAVSLAVLILAHPLPHDSAKAGRPNCRMLWKTQAVPVKLRLSISILILALVFLACGKNVSVTKNQCTAGDWQTLGYRDAAVGYRITRLLAHQDACVEFGVIPDREKYMLGWNQGLLEFCDPHSAFLHGQSGKRHHNVCPADQRDEFLRAYKEGRTLFLARWEVDDLERKLERNRLRIVAIEEQLVSTASAQLNPLLAPNTRIELLAKFKQLNDEQRRLRAEIPILEEDLVIRTNELETLNRSMAALSF